MRIFISYRRTDTMFLVPVLREALVGVVGEFNVFLDIDNIPLGVDFRDHIRAEVDKADAVLAVIGPNWDVGRLSSARDFVRIELLAARELRKLIVPVLAATEMPDESLLPEDLSWLAWLNAFSVAAPPRHGADLRRLSEYFGRLAPADDQKRGGGAAQSNAATTRRTKTARSKPVAQASRAPQTRARSVDSTSGTVNSFDTLHDAPSDNTDAVEHDTRETSNDVASVTPVDTAGVVPIVDEARSTTVNSREPAELDRLAPLRTLAGHENLVVALAWQRQAFRLATAGWDRTIAIWDQSFVEAPQRLAGHAAEVRSVTWSPDGTSLASAGGDGVRIWDLASTDASVPLVGHTDVVRSVAWSPDGRRLASAGNDGTVRIWDAVSGGLLSALSGHSRWVTSVAWSPDGSRIATSSNDRTARIWMVAAERAEYVLSGHLSAVTSVTWSLDGTRLVTTGNEGITRVWDPRTGGEIRLLAGHTDSVLSAAWQPGGIHIATASQDKSIRIWDARSGAELQCITGHIDAVTAVAWRPDGAQLASASDDGSVRIWTWASSAS